MPKKGIHCKASPTKYVMSKGELSINSAIDRESLLLDADVFTSSAWADDQSRYVNTRSGKVAQFKKSFGISDISGLMKKGGS